MCLHILSCLFPPLAVCFKKGVGCDCCINILLTLLAYFPGCLHACYIGKFEVCQGTSFNHFRKFDFFLIFAIFAHSLTGPSARSSDHCGTTTTHNFNSTFLCLRFIGTSFAHNYNRFLDR